MSPSDLNSGLDWLSGLMKMTVLRLIHETVLVWLQGVAYMGVWVTGAQIMCSHGIGSLSKWVDKHIFFQVLREVLAVPSLFLQESGHSGGILVDSSGMEFRRRPC